MRVWRKPAKRITVRLDDEWEARELAEWLAGYDMHMSIHDRQVVAERIFQALENAGYPRRVHW